MQSKSILYVSKGKNGILFIKHTQGKQNGLTGMGPQLFAILLDKGHQQKEHILKISIGSRAFAVFCQIHQLILRCSFA